MTRVSFETVRLTPGWDTPNCSAMPAWVQLVRRYLQAAIKARWRPRPHETSRAMSVSLMRSKTMINYKEVRPALFIHDGPFIS